MYRRGRAKRSQPSSAIIIDDSGYEINVGDGGCTQLAKADMDTEKSKTIFITHNYSDHVADFDSILLRAWQSGHDDVIQCFGPKLIKEM